MTTEFLHVQNLQTLFLPLKTGIILLENARSRRCVFISCPQLSSWLACAVNYSQEMNDEVASGCHHYLRMIGHVE